MIIAVDFDGTIVPDRFFPDRMPDEFMPGAKEALIRLREAGHHLILWTLRDAGPNRYSLSLGIALNFLEQNGLAFLMLPRNAFPDLPATFKCPADIYIDDKIPGGFQGWDRILDLLQCPATTHGELKTGG